MDNYRLLMEQVARLYDKYEAGRPQPFNIFSALHRESDEVNLHSRFLHALLDYKRPDDETRETWLTSCDMLAWGTLSNTV